MCLHRLFHPTVEEHCDSPLLLAFCQPLQERPRRLPDLNGLFLVEELRVQLLKRTLVRVPRLDQVLLDDVALPQRLQDRAEVLESQRALLGDEELHHDKQSCLHVPIASNHCSEQALLLHDLRSQRRRLVEAGSAHEKEVRLRVQRLAREERAVDERVVAAQLLQVGRRLLGGVPARVGHELHDPLVVLGLRLGRRAISAAGHRPCPERQSRKP
mmetsp:Transcript_117395/g.366996  ORF Transcript_117395/g.366996 Transcript_117395/m.366996 type:complete len:214 (-) Transcript_117395:7-648(-)